MREQEWIQLQRKILVQQFTDETFDRALGANEKRQSTTDHWEYDHDPDGRRSDQIMR